MTAAATATVESANQLRADAREPLRDLLLTLADNKRLLGIRYSDWMLGAPTLESGIAASSMAQDEWGHGRLTYALLSDFGDDPKQLEHEREAAAYHSMQALDRPLRSWGELIAVALLVDTALSVQYAALLDSAYSPVHNRVQKLLDEEAFHYQHAVGWARRLGNTPAVRGEFKESVARLLPEALRWLGRSGAAAALADEGVVRWSADEMRTIFLRRVAPVLAEAGIAAEIGLREADNAWHYAPALDWDGWNDATRRTGGSGPDAETLARVRGDKNRAMLLD